MSIAFGVIFFTVAFNFAHCCIQSLDGWKDVGLEERAKRAPIVFHGLAIEAIADFDDSDLYGVKFWMINIYKGADAVADLLNLDPGSGGVFNLRDRRINVTGFGDKSGCHPTVAPQKYYVIFCELRNNGLVAKFDDIFGAAAEWSEKTEARVWSGVGWNTWSDWGACSASCGEGAQERVRTCQLGDGDAMCHGYNKERRRCNMFPCLGAVDPMRLDDRRFFHPSRGEWERVASRPTAWRLRPNSYIWVPSSQIFTSDLGHRPGLFPREFTLLVTLKLSPVKPVQGTVFSLRSRRQQNAYLSLELESGDRVRVVHATNNGTQSVVIPMKLNDGHWHQLGLALQDDNSVRSFLDCAWVSTDILKRNELDHPEDADLIIGYLFQGELEQLVIVPDPSAVAQHCSSSKIPIFDPHVSALTTPVTSTSAINKEEIISWEMQADESKSKFNENKKESLIRKSISHEIDEAHVEGSGVDVLNSTDFEVEWSEWSLCSVACGPGTQTRYSRCVDDGGRMELCMEAGGEKTETRPCVMSCDQNHAGNEILGISSSDIYFKTNDDVPDSSSKNQTVTKKHHKHHKPHFKKLKTWHQSITKGRKNWCSCLNGGTCLKDGTCQCPVSYRGHLCEREECRPSCQNGGVCERKDVCICPPMFSGPRCETPNCEPPCHNGGTCIGPNTCSCPPLTSGQFCQKFECSSPCMNGGQCIGPDVCECPHNSTGRTCQEPRCEPPCENEGTCAPGNSCICATGVTGVRCEKRKCEYEPIQEPYTKGFRRLVNKKIETKCEPWSWKTCYRTVAEYQTVYKTFYRTTYKCKEPELNKNRGND